MVQWLKSRILVQLLQLGSEVCSESCSLNLQGCGDEPALRSPLIRQEEDTLWDLELQKVGLLSRLHDARTKHINIQSASVTDNCLHRWNPVMPGDEVLLTKHWRECQLLHE